MENDSRGDWGRRQCCFGEEKNLSVGFKYCLIVVVLRIVVQVGMKE